jgi:hypothetical protein
MYACMLGFIRISLYHVYSWLQNVISHRKFNVKYTVIETTISLLGICQSLAKTSDAGLASIMLRQETPCTYSISLIERVILSTSEKLTYRSVTSYPRGGPVIFKL